MRRLSQIPTPRMRPSAPRTDTTGLPWLGFLALVLLQMADLVTTQLALHAGGHEWNPLLAIALAHAGYGGLMIAKAAGAGAVLVMIDWIYRMRWHRGRRGVPRFVLLGACGWLWIACCFNTHVLLSLLHH